MLEQIDKAQLRTRQYNYTDGLLELTFAFICLVLGAFFSVQASLPPQSALYKALDLGWMFIVLGSAFFANWVVTRLKSRLTYPRTGYINTTPASGRRRVLASLLTALVAMVAAAALVTLFAKGFVSLAWFSGVTGIVFALVFLFLGWRANLLRLHLLAIAFLVAGLAFTFSGLNNLLALGLFYLASAVCLAVSGGLTLWRFIHTAPAGDGV